MEAIFVIFVGVVSVTLWLYCTVQKHFAASDALGEIALLRRREAWLQEQLDTARREQWGLDMISPILDDLTTTRHQLARVEVRPLSR